MVYQPLVEPHLTYGLAWSVTTNNHVKRLEVTQKWILKLYFLKNVMFPPEMLFEKTNVPIRC